MRKWTFVAGLLLASAAHAQTEVTAGVMQGKDYGVTYMLPKTQIEVEVKANKITYKPGEFSKYADRYLRLSDVSTEPQEYWELTGVKAQSVGVPDSENIYFVKLKDKTVAPLMELTTDGIVVSINQPISKAQSAATPTPPAQPAKKVDPREFLTQEILMANSTAKMAELVAQEIYNIRDSKNALVRGQADNMPKDGAQLKLMLDNLEEQERAMTEMFSGTHTKVERTFTIRLTPTADMHDQLLFRFSKKLGVVANNDLAGEPVLITLKDLHTVTIPPVDGKKKTVTGVTYNVPGKASLVIREGKKVWFEGELPVTQFGIKEVLAPELFNKNSTVKVTFSPITGGLIKVEREEGK